MTRIKYVKNILMEVQHESLNLINDIFTNLIQIKYTASPLPLVCHDIPHINLCSPRHEDFKSIKRLFLYFIFKKY